MARKPSQTTTTQTAPNPPANVFTPSETDMALMRAIDSGNQSGNVRYVSSAEAGHLVNAGLVTVDINKLDPNGNAAASLSETGKVHTMTTTTQTPGTTGTATGALAAAAPAVAAPVTFAIANVAPPAIKRTPPKGGGQKPKYPQLDSLDIGQAMFIPAPAGADTKKLSKQFGSMMADRNSRDKAKYFTSRGIPDGKEAGFVDFFAADAIDPATNAPYPAGTINPDAFAGVAGTGLYRRPVEERKTRAPRKPKAGTVGTTPDKTPEQLAAEAAAVAAAGQPTT